MPLLARVGVAGTAQAGWSSRGKTALTFGSAARMFRAIPRRDNDACIQPSEGDVMPIYEYRCSSCGHQLESLQKLSDAPLTDCPECNKSTLQKQISAAGFRLSGGGWYETDFKSGNKRNVAEKSDQAEKSEKSEKKEASGASAGGGHSCGSGGCGTCS